MFTTLDERDEEFAAIIRGGFTEFCWARCRDGVFDVNPDVQAEAVVFGLPADQL